MALAPKKMMTMMMKWHLQESRKRLALPQVPRWWRIQKMPSRQQMSKRRRVEDEGEKKKQKMTKRAAELTVQQRPRKLVQSSWL